MEETKQIYSFPPLSDEEFAELKEDIAERGVMVPIEVDEVGSIIDGYHRLKACRELGITDIPFICREGWTEQEKRTQAIKLNIARRHLTQEQKQKLVRAQIKETPEKSDRQIAGDLGVNNSTVSRQRKKMEETGDVLQCNTSIDTLGREQPRRRKTPESNPAAQEAADEPAPEDVEGFINEPTPDMQKPAEPEDIPEENETPAREMTAAEDMLMGLEDEAKRLRRVLNMMLDDFEDDEDIKEMLFSHDGVEAALKGLSEIREVLNEYEEIVRARERKPE